MKIINFNAFLLKKLLILRIFYYVLNLFNILFVYIFHFFLFNTTSVSTFGVCGNIS